MAHILKGATNVTVNGGSFVANAGGPSKGLDKLIGVVAPNAILNAGGRADEVRCYPGTREEVIGKLEKFLDDDSPDRKRMMWLSGPAGAGKSAILQTVAEGRSEQAANFFFFRGDQSRRHSKPLVATLVYQLRSFYPALDELLSDYLAKDPLICSASIEKQFKQRISFPIESIRQSTPIQLPIMIIIDGLDECNNDEREQDQILVALHRLAHADDSPFRVLVSSRAEPQLVMSFNRLGDSAESIFLNEDYHPRKDIHHFVVAKFAEVKRDHHLAQTLDKNWPTPADIDAIVNKSSGQFIYSATVMRYIQFSSEHPALSLTIILEMPPSANRNPLAHLDTVYSYIFSRVHNIRVVKLILLARDITKFYPSPRTVLSGVLQVVGYQSIHVQSFFSDLAAIIKVTPEPHSKGIMLEFYHASLEDYLNDKSRSTIYYVNENEIAAELSCTCWKNVHDHSSFMYAIKPLNAVQRPTIELTQSLLDASTKHLSGKKRVLDFECLIGNIERLYWKEDEDQFKVLLQSWSRFVHVNNPPKSTHSVVKPKNPLASPYYEQYWMIEGYSGQEPPVPPDSALAGVARSNFQTSSAQAFSNAVIGRVRRPGASSQSIPAAPPKDQRGSSTPAHITKSNTQTALTRAPLNSAIGSVRKPGAYSRNTPAALPKGRGGGSLMGRPSGSGSVISTSQKDEDKFSIIQVKLHYQNGTRVMRLTPDTPFSEFVDKITMKFGKRFHALTIIFKDKDGDEITLGDDSDYEHAIETARQSSKGKAEGKLEIWCHDSA